MANLKLVGAVAIKVRPDAKGFRREAQVEIDRELAGLKPKVKIKVEMDVDATKAKEEAAAAKEEIEKGGLKLRVGIDTESIIAAQRKLDAALKHIHDEVIVVKLDDEGSIAAAQARLDAMRRDSKVNIEFTPDERGFREVLARIAEIKRDNIIKETIEFDFDNASLDAQAALIQARLDALKPHEKITLEYDENRASLERLVHTIDAELARINRVKIEVDVNNLSLTFAKAYVEEAIGQLPVKLEYDANEAGLRSLKARLEAALPKLHIETTLDEAAVRREIAKVDAQIKEAEQNKLKIKPEVSAKDYLQTLAAIKFLARNQTVHIFTRLDNSGILLAAAKLTGLRAATRWTEEFTRALGTLDRNLPIVAAAVIGISTLSSGILTLTADAFSLGNGLGEVVRMGLLMAPALLLGLGSVMVVLKAVFKDFGAAAHGITAAMKRLPPAGQEAARTFQQVFATIREDLSKSFWDRASDGMLRFSKVALPALGSGLTLLSGSLGGIFSHLLESFSRLTEQSGVKVFFDNMSHGFDLAQTGLSDFMNGFLTLALVGSTAFPRIGRAFNSFADKFDAWVQRIAADGTLQRWIDIGVQGMHDLTDIAGSLIRVWGNIGLAAQAAGAFTLHTFAQAFDRLDQITAGARFQKNMRTIFEGAKDASETFHKALGNLGPAFDVFSVTVRDTLKGAASALGSFISVLGNVISSPNVGVGLTAFLTGVKALFESLRPAAASVATILQTFGQILGRVATDSGPLFRTLFQSLATVLVTAWHALEPFLPALIQIGTDVLNVLAPALNLMASAVIPAFAGGLERIGTGMVPVIKFFADFAAGATVLLSALPAPVLAGMVAGILSLGTAFAIAGKVIPIAVAALKQFQIAAAFTAISTDLLIPGLGIVLAAATAIGIGALADFATQQHSATPFANEYADAILADAKALGTFSDALGENATKLALKNLQDSHAFENAQKIGLTSQQVVDGVTKGGEAWDVLQKRIADVTGEYDTSFKAAQKAVAGQQQFAANVSDKGPNQALGDRKQAADALTKSLKENKDSIDAGRAADLLSLKVNKEAGIDILGRAEAQKTLTTQVEKTSKALGVAAAATTVLNDSFSSGPAKIDAMRKSLEILVPPNTAQKVAEGLGAYVTGFNNIKDTVKGLAPTIQSLGKDAFGETGFLNIAGGNKAVLQVNQALIDQVNNTWLGAKTAFDNSKAAGDDAQTAFGKAKKFVDDHRVDFEELAKISGVSADQVNGQWEAVFGKEWLLKVTLSGGTEAAAQAQALVTALRGNFDGKKYQAFVDADASRATKQFTDAKGLAEDYVNSEWVAQLDALPTKAEGVLQTLLRKVDATWTQSKDFIATLEVAKDIPGLQQALLDIRNGVGKPFYASIFASLNNASYRAVLIALGQLTMPRVVAVRVAFDNTGGGDPVARGGQRQITSANGNILNGRGIRQFANGGIENHVAQISRAGGPIRIWGEPETQGEAYLPLSPAKRARSVAILGEVARRFGYNINRAQQFADGGTVTQGAASRPVPHTSVTVGTINTVDPESAVRKLRTLQRDALAVAGIS